jgi:hypothetical protein
MATVHLGRSRPDPVAARRWLLEVVETRDGVLALDRLPEDRETRLSVLYRLRASSPQPATLTTRTVRATGPCGGATRHGSSRWPSPRPRSVSWSSWWPRMRTPSAPRRAEPDQH